MKHSIVLGADIGGSHITTALIDQHSRSIIPGSLYRAHVNSHGSAGEIIKCWGDIIQKSLDTANGVNQIGIAMPGPLDYEAGISLIRGLHKYEALYGLNIKELLAQQLQTEARYIKIANDARCFLQGELFNGAVKNQHTVTGLILGTGFGSAIAENGIARDASFFETPFLASRAEDYFCSRWFVKRYNELTSLQTVTNVKEIAALAATECPAAIAVFHEFGSNLALFLSLLRPTPELVLLGGNIAKTFSLFNPALQEGLNKYHLQISFVLSILGEDAPLLGAASII
ncbi:glucokinase [Chitinophaga niastensis]|uniref:Glucokinase n=1 Tax=Chitinophaga niastensis TaxID=536980 RepID=A0A2P8HHJ5_CHINA|nr:ROK family protein [Chitinophaga niastensis]PSL45659.1 glucokinase [Chitinophaga niastensis]